MLCLGAVVLFSFHYGRALVRATATMPIAATTMMITAAPIRSSEPDDPVEYPGMEEVDPDEFGPKLDEPMLTGIVVLCERDPLVSVTVTV